MSFNDLAAAELALAAHISEVSIIEKRLNGRMDTIVEAVTANTKKSIEILELYENLQGAFKVLGWVESFATWVVKVAALGGILWATWKFILAETITQATKKP